MAAVSTEPPTEARNRKRVLVAREPSWTRRVHPVRRRAASTRRFSQCSSIVRRAVPGGRGRAGQSADSSCRFATAERPRVVSAAPAGRTVRQPPPPFRDCETHCRRAPLRRRRDGALQNLSGQLLHAFRWHRHLPRLRPQVQDGLHRSVAGGGALELQPQFRVDLGGLNLPHESTGTRAHARRSEIRDCLLQASLLAASCTNGRSPLRHEPRSPPDGRSSRPPR